MANGIRTGDSHGFYKGRSSKICEGSRVRQTPEGRRTYWLKRYGNNKDEDNSPKTLNDKKLEYQEQFIYKVTEHRNTNNISNDSCDYRIEGNDNINSSNKKA